VEVLALGQPGHLFDERLPPAAGGADRQRGLVGDQRAGGEVLSERPGGGVHPAEVGLPGVVVHEQRHDHDHGVAAGDGVGVVGGGPQTARGDQLGQLLAQVGLAGEGLAPLVDDIDQSLVDVDPDDFMALAGELHGQREADLPQGDDGDAHG
jgi:hypothetical protein